MYPASSCFYAVCHVLSRRDSLPISPSLVVAWATLHTSQPNAGIALLLCLPSGFSDREVRLFCLLPRQHNVAACAQLPEECPRHRVSIGLGCLTRIMPLSSLWAPWFLAGRW